MKGLPPKQCTARAEQILQEQDLCLLLFDVKDSKNIKDLNKKLHVMIEDIYLTFEEYLPRNDLGVPQDFIKGFRIFRGDSGYAAINSIDAISEIQKYQKEKYPEIELYWGIAKDGLDDNGFNFF